MSQGDSGSLETHTTTSHRVPSGRRIEFLKGLGNFKPIWGRQTVAGSDPPPLLILLEPQPPLTRGQQAHYRGGRVCSRAMGLTSRINRRNCVSPPAFPMNTNDPGQHPAGPPATPTWQWTPIPLPGTRCSRDHPRRRGGVCL